MCNLIGGWVKNGEYPGNYYCQCMHYLAVTGKQRWYLAVLIGNAHGHYKKPPCLDIERVKAIREATGGVPLVLHGGSGIPDDQVKAAIRAGVRKMNIGTDVCCAFADGTKKALEDPGRSIAVDVFMKVAVAQVKSLALDKIRMMGADGKA